jgi:hypothetical protein
MALLRDCDFGGKALDMHQLHLCLRNLKCKQYSNEKIQYPSWQYSIHLFSLVLNVANFETIHYSLLVNFENPISQVKGKAVRVLN